MKHLRMLFYLLLSVAGLMTIAACDDDDPEARKPVVLVVNEGQFLRGNGSLTSFDPEAKTHTGDVFPTANAGRNLSANVQSVTVADDDVYVVCNQADKIEWLGDDFAANAAPIEDDDDLVTPRYLAVSGNRAFVSVWGPYTLPSFDLDSSKVAVINRITFAIEDWIEVPAGPEGIVVAGGKVFVACSFTDTVVVINPGTLAVEKKIKTNTGPTSLAVDKDGQVWAICTGEDALQRINVSTLAIDRTVGFSGKGLRGKVAMNAAKDRFFLLGAEPWPGTKGFVYSHPLSATAAPSAALVEGESFYGVGVDPRTGTIYVGNSNSFQGEGTVLRYNADGSTLDNFPAGIGPNGFVFFDRVDKPVEMQIDNRIFSIIYLYFCIMELELIQRLMPYTGLPLPHNVLIRVLADYARPNDKIHDYRKKGILSNLKKGVYFLHLPHQSMQITKELAANHIYGPSYVSMDYVLFKQGLIPERVFEITSVTPKHSKVFENELGRFRYTFLPLPYYAFGIERQLVGEQQYALVASVEKAICDKIIRTNGAK